MVNTVSVLIRTPDRFFGSHTPKEKLKENYDIKEIIYDKIYPEIPLDVNQTEFLSLDKLPTRLYNIETKQVEKINKNSQVKNYAALSYVWGGNYNKETGELSEGGKKSLKKAIEVCRRLGINYLWVDQLCINQRDEKDKYQEVPKMRQYYNNSVATLIAIQAEVGGERKFYLDLEQKDDNEVAGGESHCKILEMIYRSEWFSRSWTYQEGLLSKNTIFMFDDILIDGRFMALIWKLEQYANLNYSHDYLRKFCKNGEKEKTATPLGWVYHREGYKENDVVNLSLSEALRETKTRKRTMPIDGIYSIIGLLPYGKDVNVNYSLTLEQSLVEVMKVAVKNGYGEPLAWHGPSNKSPSLCWLPETDNNGSSKVEGGLEISCLPESVNFTENGIEVTGTEYIINSAVENIWITDGNHIVDGGLVNGKIVVKIEDSYETITLSGTGRMLGKIESGNILLVLNKTQWKNKENFVVLASKENGNYHRIDIARIKEGAEKLKGENEKKLLIGVKKKFANFQQHQANIEQPPK